MAGAGGVVNAEHLGLTGVATGPSARYGVLGLPSAVQPAAGRGEDLHRHLREGDGGYLPGDSLVELDLGLGLLWGRGVSQSRMGVTPEVALGARQRLCCKGPDAGQLASGIEAVWFHRSADCDGADGPTIQSVSGGADLLQSNAVTDISLLRLRRPAPAGAVFAPWSPHPSEPGAQLVSVHHPEGRRQAIAFGQRTGLVACADVPLCEDDSASAEAHYLEVTWDRGGTEIGSSGAGLFLASGQLVGVLSGGYGDCQGRQGADHYGRFDLSYRSGLVRWLGR